jgi:hypothetical protein
MNIDKIAIALFLGIIKWHLAKLKLEAYRTHKNDS